MLQPKDQKVNMTCNDSGVIAWNPRENHLPTNKITSMEAQTTNASTMSIKKKNSEKKLAQTCLFINK